MTHDAFEYFESVAGAVSDPTLIAGRYGFQREAELQIIPEVAAKLDLSAGDRLLDVGGGPGNISVPLAPKVRELWLIDNQRAVDIFKARTASVDNARALPGRFENVDLPFAFEKILVYSVVQYMSGLEAIEAFIRKACHYLAPGGRMLVGDLPNESRKARFLTSREGKQANEVWRRSIESETSTRTPASLSSVPPIDVRTAIDDFAIMRLVLTIRTWGLEAFILPQGHNLPFSNTREDILIVKRA